MTRGRKPSSKPWTTRYIQALERGGRPKIAAGEIGINYGYSRRLRQRDNQFNAHCHRALAAYHLAQADMLEETTGTVALHPSTTTYYGICENCGELADCYDDGEAIVCIDARQCRKNLRG